MAWYLWLKPQNEPYDIDLDGPGRVKMAFQVMAMKEPSGTFIEELVGVLEDASVGSFGTDIFAVPSLPAISKSASLKTT